jgi:hypothetical protein
MSEVRRPQQLPTYEEIEALQWPLHDVARMLRYTKLVLSLSDITDDEARRIAEHLNQTNNEPADLPDCDKAARAINGVKSELGPDGWIVPAMPPEQYLIQAQHVAAVAALLAGRRLLDLQSELSKLAFVLPGAADSGNRLADLNLTALACRCCSLAMDAIFMVSRVEMQRAMEAREAERRSEAGRKGAEALHAATRDAKALVLEWWGERSGTMTKEAAADAIVAARLVGEGRATIRRWLQGA